MTGALKFFFNWSHNVGETVSNWFEGGSIVTNEDGVYWDPTGQQGDKIKDENAADVDKPAQESEKNKGSNEDAGSTGGESDATRENSNNQNSEVQNE